MSIITQANTFIQTWEQQCQASDFTLRFPVFSEFLNHLEEHTSYEIFTKITSDQAKINNLRTFFHSMLRAHIQDLCIQEELWEEKLSIA